MNYEVWPKASYFFSLLYKECFKHFFSCYVQMLLCHRVQAVVADTCRNCCLTSNLCACRQAYSFAHGSGSSVSYYRQDHDRSTCPGNSSNNNIGNIYLSESQGDGGSLFGSSRVHVS
jgi:hypothetical protein